MGQKMSDGEKVLVAVGVGLSLLGLYYLTAGYDKENDALLIPDVLEDRIDHVVGTLNAKFGKNWVNWSTDQLKAYLRNTMPQPLVALVDVVYAVEQATRRGRIARYTKRQHAIAMATAWGIA